MCHVCQSTDVRPGPTVLIHWSPESQGQMDPNSAPFRWLTRAAIKESLVWQLLSCVLKTTKTQQSPASQTRAYSLGCSPAPLTRDIESGTQCGCLPWNCRSGFKLSSSCTFKTVAHPRTLSKGCYFSRERWAGIGEERQIVDWEKKRERERTQVQRIWSVGRDHNSDRWAFV